MMITKSLYDELQEFRKTQKTHLRASWTLYLVDLWKGETYNDYVLLMWLQSKRSDSSFHKTKIKLHNIIIDKSFLQFENLEFRTRIKSKLAQEHRKKHYRALLGFNRRLINQYIDLTRHILGGVTS